MYVGIFSVTPDMPPLVPFFGQKNVTTQSSVTASNLYGTAVRMSVKSKWVTEGLTDMNSFIKVLERSRI